MAHLGFSFGAPYATPTPPPFGGGIHAPNAHATPYIDPMDAVRDRRIRKEVRDCEPFLEDGCEFLGRHTRMSSLTYEPDERVARFRLDFYQAPQPMLVFPMLPIHICEKIHRFAYYEPRVSLDMEFRFHISHASRAPRLVLVECSESTFRGFYEYKVDVYNEAYNTHMWSPCMTFNQACLLFVVSVDFLADLMQADADGQSSTMTEAHRGATQSVA